MRDRILVRVDGNSKIGHGHLGRCLALASMLRSLYEVKFCFVDTDALVRQKAVDDLFLVLECGSESSFFEILGPHDLVVLDGYSFPLEYQSEVARKVKGLIVIDDLAIGNYCADIIINHAPGVSSRDYNTTKNTTFLLGPSYALLRPEFQDVASESRVLEDVKNVVVCFGGADPQNITGKVVNCILTSGFQCNVTVIIGSGYIFQEDLLRLREGFGNYFNIFRALGPTEMLSQFCTHSLAIVPASGVLFEALACKMLVISGTYVDNQNRIHKGFKDLGAIIDAYRFEDENIVRALNVAASLKLPIQMSNSNLSIDGRAPDRIRNAIRSQFNS